MVRWRYWLSHFNCLNISLFLFFVVGLLVYIGTAGGGLLFVGGRSELVRIAITVLGGPFVLFLYVFIGAEFGSK
jgi:hypothetical protein